MEFILSVLLTVQSLFIFFTSCSAQQIPENLVPNQWPDLSSGCATALNTTVHCAGILPAIFIE
jgi:hypothetical protein